MEGKDFVEGVGGLELLCVLGLVKIFRLCHQLLHFPNKFFTTLKRSTKPLLINIPYNLLRLPSTQYLIQLRSQENRYAQFDTRSFLM